jgi:hypothetical protein
MHKRGSPKIVNATACASCASHHSRSMSKFGTMRKCRYVAWRLANLPPFLRMPGEERHSADRVNCRIQAGPHIVDHQSRADSFVDFAAIHRVDDRLRPASWLQLAAHRLRCSVVHHFLKHRKSAAGPFVQWPKAIEHLLGPHEHSLAALLRKSYRTRHNVNRQSGGKVCDDTKLPLRNQAIDQLLRLCGDLGLQRIQRRRGQRFRDDATKR